MRTPCRFAIPTVSVTPYERAFEHKDADNIKGRRREA